MEIASEEVVRYVSSIPEKDWTSLYRGAHSEVFLIKHPNRSDEKKYVVKKIKTATAWKNKQKEIRELVILQDVRHERIVTFYGHINRKFELLLIMGFMPKGSLSSYVFSKPLHLTKIRLFTCQILKGVEYLHSKSIIHRDIKGANVLLEDEDNVRLADFGVSKVISEMSNATTNSAGTYNYKAPETFEIGVVYDTKADIWSIGCTAVEMHKGQLPFGVMSTTSEMIETVKKKVRPDQSCENVPTCLQEFFDKCFKFQPSERPTAEELLRDDEFLQNMRN